MNTKYFPAVEIPDFDDQIDEVLERTSFDGGGNSMFLAIENRAGQVYRVVEVIGLGEFMNTVYGLLDLGFIDLLQDKPASKQGYDSLLRPTNVPVAVVESQQVEWSDAELRSAVDAYLWMLAEETKGKPYSKADVNRQLREGPLSGRSKASIEYRMQNISAALDELCMPRINGYVPAKNVGAGVKDKIRLALENAGVFQHSDYAVSSDIVELDAKVANIRRKISQGTPRGIDVPQRVSATTQSFVRDPLVKAWVLENAKGVCESCAQPAPFFLEDGTPFLEVHHVIPLAEDGPDKITNAVALCPNCHRRHHLAADRKSLVEGIYKRLPRLVR